MPSCLIRLAAAWCGSGDKGRVGGFIKEPATPLQRSNHNWFCFPGLLSLHPPVCSPHLISDAGTGPDQEEKHQTRAGNEL